MDLAWLFRAKRHRGLPLFWTYEDSSPLAVFFPLHHPFSHRPSPHSFMDLRLLPAIAAHRSLTLHKASLSIAFARIAGPRFLYPCPFWPVHSDRTLEPVTKSRRAAPLYSLFRVFTPHCNLARITVSSREELKASLLSIYLFGPLRLYSLDRWPFHHRLAESRTWRSQIATRKDSRAKQLLDPTMAAPQPMMKVPHRNYNYSGFRLSICLSYYVNRDSSMAVMTWCWKALVWRRNGWAESSEWSPTGVSLASTDSNLCEVSGCADRTQQRCWSSDIASRRRSRFWAHIGESAMLSIRCKDLSLARSRLTKLNDYIPPRRARRAPSLHETGIDSEAPMIESCLSMWCWM